MLVFRTENLAALLDLTTSSLDCSQRLDCVNLRTLSQASRFAVAKFKEIYNDISPATTHLLRSHAVFLCDRKIAMSIEIASRCYVLFSSSTVHLVTLSVSGSCEHRLASPIFLLRRSLVSNFCCAK